MKNEIIFSMKSPFRDTFRIQGFRFGEIEKRFWAMDNTDINRMFPGYNQGETTQRIAAALFEAIQGYTYGIRLASFYVPGDFVPHVRIDYNSRLLDEEELVPVRTPVSGILYKMKHACDSVKKGEVMACVIDPYYGQVLMEIQAPSSGIIFFAHNKPLVLQNTVVYKIV
ncbi:hypothetical protein [uncultured Bacteroides sp.]|uniref:hypothetical protein n=1 Tax=uncultured Bacteroides sp. TaxID=162156 RepID=UPI0026121474|nr:hypothetical protein [uncultured Bacteroides sp.]